MSGSERILFVDDDPPVRTAFARTLRTRGFDVELADSPANAIKMAETQEYAVIATDYRMPDIDGLELVAELRNQQPLATYMLVSGECDLELAMAAVNNHNVSYVITKPWDADELDSLLRRGIESHQERRVQVDVQRNLVTTSRNIESQKERLQAAFAELESHMSNILLNALELATGHETRAHCHRVAAYALLLVKGLGIQGDAVRSIRIGALLHDIGKLAIPASIMFKPGPLDAAEAQKMREHPLIGAQLLDGIESLVGARRIVLEHHECWDGSGYPAKLTGDKISLGGRVMAVADSLEAMLTDRPYRKALTVDEARREIMAKSGTQFDPAVISAFARIEFQELLDVRLAHPEPIAKSSRNAA